jgi:phosphoserine phosphatase
MSQVLFVYGTLRPDVQSAMGTAQRRRLAGEARDLGPATTEGLLADLGAYPGLVDGDGRVRGRAYALRTPADTFAWLDAYEGLAGRPDDEYRRIVRGIALDTGVRIEAWVYRYNGPQKQPHILTSGDWIAACPAIGRQFAAVGFDCDSTLTTLEGIDELAARAGLAAEIAPLTTAAMDGTLTIEEVYGRRLDLIRPDQAAIAWLGRRYRETLVAGAAETVAALLAAGISVHIVSGGLLQPVMEVAVALGIPAAHVHAVAVHFDAAGRYAGFDTSSPLTRADGKATVCRGIAARYGATALVGDGVTDLRARDGGATVIGFGGVVARPAVVAGADVFIAGPDLRDTLALLLPSG